MANIRDITALQDWLKGQPVEFACLIAMRIALRVVPILELALREDEADKRGGIIMSNFRALVAVSYAGAGLDLAESIGNAAWSAVQESYDMIVEHRKNVPISIIEIQEIMDGDFNESEIINQIQNDDYALEVASYVLNASVEAMHSVVAFVDFAKGIGSSATVFEAATTVAKFAEQAVNETHDNRDLCDGLDKDEQGIAPHIKDFWNAVELDIEQLVVDESCKFQPKAIVKNLSEKALWLGEPPIWVSERWRYFRRRLPSEENWQVWINWYEARLAGQQLDEALESELLSIPDEEWKKGAIHVNAIIAELIASRSDPLLTAVVRGFEELESVRRHCSIDLTGHMDRIKAALPNDPYLVIGSTKDMLEATMKTILDGRVNGETDKLSFSTLTNQCFTELGLKASSLPATNDERHIRKIADSAQKMVQAANDLRNRVGTGHGRVVGKEPVITPADASLVASVGMILASWLLRHSMEKNINAPIVSTTHDSALKI